MDDLHDTTMLRVRDLFEASGLTLEVLGQRMGYGSTLARKAAWQFIHRTNDPRLSMLRKFVRAINLPLADLFAEPKGRAK